MVHICCGARQFPDIQAIIFDKDGTLADVRQYLIHLGLERSHRLDNQLPGAGDRLQKAFGMQGKALDPFGLLAVGTRQENAIAAATYLAETGYSWQQAMQIVQAVFQSADRALPPKAAQTPPFPGIPPLLRHLSEAGLKLAVLSSDSLENITAFLEHHRLQSWFQGWMGAEPGKPTKPDPILVHYLCDQMGVTPATTLMVGDAPGDLQMAQASGMAGGIGVTWGWGDRPWQDKQQLLVNLGATFGDAGIATMIAERVPAPLSLSGCVTTLAHAPTDIQVRSNGQCLA